MLAQAVQYTNDAAGLEKTLRLFQGLSTIAVGLSSSSLDAAPWEAARSQFAASRRFFRLLKWQPCWQKAVAAFESREAPSSLGRTLETLKWLVLGMYFFLEMFTITNVIGLSHSAWAVRMQDESNKCWFYALCISILSAIYQLYAQSSSATAVQRPVAEEKAKDAVVAQEKEAKAATKPDSRAQTSAIRQTLYAQIVIDACDLFLPGAALGWIPASNLTVGCASTISTSLAGYQIGQRIFGAAVV